MSTLSKFFVVVNFILAICFMIASLTLYAKKIHWVETARSSDVKRNELALRSKDFEDRYNKLKGQYIGTIKQQELALDTVADELKTTKKEYIQLQALHDNAIKDLKSINQSIADVRDELKSLEQKNNELTADRNKFLKERDEAVLAREFAEKQAIEAVADLKEAETEMLSLSKKNHALMDRIMQQDVVIDRVRKQGIEIDRLLAGTSAIPISGRVLQVEEAVGIVILNIGDKNKVKPGMEFVLSRGNTYVGKVRVRNIYDDMCSAVMIRELMQAPVQVSDIAQTGL